MEDDDAGMDDELLYELMSMADAYAKAKSDYNVRLAAGDCNERLLREYANMVDKRRRELAARLGELPVI